MNSFNVPGPPVGKGRPKMTVIAQKKSSNVPQSEHITAKEFNSLIKNEKPYSVKTYTPAKTANYEQLVKYSFLEQTKQTNPVEGYIKLDIIARFPIPKSTTKKNRALMLSGEIRPAKTPDIDNITKAILDGLNKVLYKDDKQVIELSVKKEYSEDPCVIVSYEII